jgi:hypothetical protein
MKMKSHRGLCALFVVLAVALSSLPMSGCSSTGDSMNSPSGSGSGGSGGY